MDFPDNAQALSGETEQDRRETRADEGFTGTLRGFIDWIADLLMYGGLVEKEPKEHPVFRGREVVEISLITGGFSTDEHLLSRVFRDSFMLRSWWESTHSGGLYVYLVPTSELASDEEREWLKPADGVFEVLARARSVQIVAPDGSMSYLPFVYQGGLELVYRESGDWLSAEGPKGTLVVRPWSDHPDVVSAPSTTLDS